MLEKYSREKMVVPSRKSTKTERVLYRYGKCLGLCPFTLDDVEIFKRSYYGLVYGIIMITVFSWIFLNAIKRRVETKLPGETPMAMMANCFADIFQFSSICLTWFIFAFRQKRIATIVESFIETGVTASKLGIVGCERDRFFKNLAIHVILINVSFLSYVVMDHAQLFLQIDFADPTYFVLFNGLHVICRNLVIIFIDSLLLVRDRFARLNEATRKLAIIGRDVRNVKSLRTGSDRVSSLTERIEVIGQLHRELTDLAEMIRDFFSPPLLFIVTMHFIQLVANCYITWLSILGYQSMDWEDAVSFVMIVIWLSVNLVEPFVITEVCRSTSNEARRTATVLHEMWNEYGSTSARCSLVIDMVSLSLLQNQLNMTLYGFIDLDPKLMSKIIGTTTTYVIIMMQLDQQQSEKYARYALRSSHFH